MGISDVIPHVFGGAVAADVALAAADAVCLPVGCIVEGLLEVDPNNALLPGRSSARTHRGSSGDSKGPDRTGIDVWTKAN